MLSLNTGSIQLRGKSWDPTTPFGSGSNWRGTALSTTLYGRVCIESDSCKLLYKTAESHFLNQFRRIINTRLIERACRMLKSVTDINCKVVRRYNNYIEKWPTYLTPMDPTAAPKAVSTSDLKWKSGEALRSQIDTNDCENTNTWHW